MKELITKVTNAEGREVSVMDSREVAEMMEKTHAEIIQYLEGLNYKDGRVKITGIIPTLEQSGDLQVANYFIESTYNDRGRIKKCYLITKMGCELLGNKLQGAKGILFSAKYVERFNQMERMLKEQSMDSYSLDTLKGLALLKVAEGKGVVERIGGATEYANLVSKPLIDKIEEDKPKVTYYDDVLNTKGSMTTTQIAKSFGMTSHKLNTYLNDKGIQYKKSGMWNLYKEYDGKGYTEVRTYVNKKKETTTHYLVWTEKGKEFIYNLLLEDKLIK